MKIRSIIAVGTLVLSMSAAHAADPAEGTKPLTRSQVKKSVVDARAKGELTTGEAPNYPAAEPQTTGKRIKRKPKAAPAADAAATDSATKKP